MRIAEVAPLHESVPPKAYGGTERVVHFLTEELVRLGHEVTLFASADSRTTARLVPCAPAALRLDGRCLDPIPHHLAMLDEVAERAREFDVIHFHLDYLSFPVSRTIETPHLTTCHNRLDQWDLEPAFRQFSAHPLVSISDAQRAPFPDASWVGTVYHGLPESLYRPRTASHGEAEYFVFLGRISREKRVDRAIEIARCTRIPLKIAAKISKNDEEYFRGDIEPLFRDPLVEYLGEVGEEAKGRLLAGALALLFPIDWPEPFGLVMIESLACGTPVIAFRNGSVPEVLRHGVTGFVVDDLDEACEAARRVRDLSRAVCRREFEGRFSVRQMAREYLRLYGSITRRRRSAWERPELCAAGPAVEVGARQEIAAAASIPRSRDLVPALGGRPRARGTSWRR